MSQRAKRQKTGKAQVRSLYLWLGMQIVLVLLMLGLGWILFVPSEVEIDNRLAGLLSETSDMSRTVRGLYLMRQGAGFAIPFAVMGAMFLILAWSIKITVREIADWQERLGARR